MNSCGDIGEAHISAERRGIASKFAGRSETKRSFQMETGAALELSATGNEFDTILK